MNVFAGVLVIEVTSRGKMESGRQNLIEIVNKTLKEIIERDTHLDVVFSLPLFDQVGVRKVACKGCDARERGSDCRRQMRQCHEYFHSLPRESFVIVKLVERRL